MQTTLLGLAIAFIIALIAALVGPYFIDWNQLRPQFEAEATRIVGAPVRGERPGDLVELGRRGSDTREPVEELVARDFRLQQASPKTGEREIEHRNLLR